MDERGLCQRPQSFQGGSRDDLGCRLSETAGEDTQPGHGPLLCAIQCLPDAVEHDRETSMPVGQIRQVRDEHLLTPFDLVQETGRRQQSGPAGCQLDGQRQPRQIVTEVGDRWILGIHVLSRSDQPGPPHEELDRIRPGPARILRRRHRWYGEHLLATQPQRRPTGRQHAELRAPRHQHRHQSGTGGCHLLAVVQHEQGGLRRQPPHEQILSGSAGIRRQPEHPRHRGRHRPGIADRCQRNPPDRRRRSRTVRGELASQLGRQA